ncbi:hypothetical protein E2562_024404 [Oryza meyeriana var. granulata]|uniref:Transposase MuDR plant domain-containing protein n=1 Tax=Oryza meyeriana var. granulata TaxID=110450 RepID=A0A6G1CAB1_9ORYZ|nr:hypothetical protein E2562_024404 [Oryza meyeriana var. granulata]
MVSMKCTWHELVAGLDAEPALSLDVGGESVFVVSPDGVVEPVPAPAVLALGVATNVVDWDRLEILSRNDDEGRLVIVGDDEFYELLRLMVEDEQAEMDKGANVDTNAGDGYSATAEDTCGAAIPIDDAVPGERVIVYDPNKPCMKAATIYPNMKEFRLAMRQFVINKEFELDLVKTNPKRYIGGSKVEGFPWHIVGRRQPDQKTIMVTVLTDILLGVGNLIRRQLWKRKVRRNTTKYGTSSDIPSPKRTSVQAILEGSPGRVTRSRLAMLVKGATTSSSQAAQIAATSSQVVQIAAISSYQPAQIAAPSSQPAQIEGPSSQLMRRTSPRRKLTSKKKLRI